MNRTRKASRSEFVFLALAAVSILWVDAGAKTEPLEAVPLPPRMERFSTIETLEVGEFAVELGRRDDGAFGLGNVGMGTLPLRRTDSLITWQVDGKYPAFERRSGLTVFLQEPPATLTFTPQKRQCAGTTFDGLQLEFKTAGGVVVETASWELGGSTQGLSYFDGYRGWHAPPRWQQADAVSPTNPKLIPSLLAGTGFQLQYGLPGALLHFHTTPGDHLRNVSRGAALEFETTFYRPGTITRYVFTATGEGSSHGWLAAFRMGLERRPFVKKSVSEQWILSCRSLGRSLVYHL